MSQSSYKTIRAPRIWTSALVPDDYRQYLKDKTAKIYVKTGRRPRKFDYTESEYKAIFNHFKRLSFLLEEIGLGHLPDIRFWQALPPEVLKANQKECIKKWGKANPEKLKEYRRRKYGKLSLK